MGWGMNDAAKNLDIPSTTYKWWEKSGVPDKRLYQVYRGFGNKPTPPPQQIGYIDDVPRDENGTPIKCKGCYYRHGMNKVGLCNYGLQTGTPRYCTIEECDKYVKGVYKSQNELY